MADKQLFINLSQEDFIKWLEEQPIETAFYPGDPCNCPLAKFGQAKVHPLLRVAFVFASYINDAGTMLQQERLAIWQREFLHDFDMHNENGKSVSRNAVLKLARQRLI